MTSDDIHDLLMAVYADIAMIVAAILAALYVTGVFNHG